MRLVPLLLGFLFLSHSALAFECSGVTFPSSIVICSDPDLIKLADERQQIYNETRARLTPEQQKALWEDQKTWVRSYATACGVSPGSPPPIPAPQSVIACFKRSAVERAAFLRTYGPSGNSADGPAIQTSADIDEVALVKAGELFTIPVRINGAITLHFTIDSGASDVQVPLDVFSTLIRANTIEESDLLGKQTYVLADGSKQELPKFRIRELKIGHHTLRNVTANVGAPKGDLLLGQSFLTHFDSWTMDNKRHVLKLVGSGAETSADIAPSKATRPVQWPPSLRHQRHEA